MELRDEDDVDPPIGRDAAWIAAEPNLQKEAKGKGVGEANQRPGKKVKTTPVRSLEAGAFCMEVWVEEDTRKFKAFVEEAGDEI